jgi:hypothetical protein
MLPVFKEKSNYPEFSAYPDGGPSPLIRVIGGLLFLRRFTGIWIGGLPEMRSFNKESLVNFNTKVKRIVFRL